MTKRLRLPRVNLPMQFDVEANYSSTPLITVIVRTYPGDWHLLPRAMASVYSQTLKPENVEVLIVNDGPLSPEEEEKIVSSLPEAKYPTQLLSTERAYGYYCVSSNMGIVLSTGLYIAHLDADNEWTPEHLMGLLKAIRTPLPTTGLPHFSYARRRYVLDPGANPNLPQGISPPHFWEGTRLAALTQSPKDNFIDSSDFLIGRGAMYALAASTGFMWNPDCRRFGDWELACRFVGMHFRGALVRQQVSNIYHWTGHNLQTVRKAQEALRPVAMPASVVEAFQANPDLHSRLKGELK